MQSGYGKKARRTKAGFEIAGGSVGALISALGLLASAAQRNPSASMGHLAILAPSIYGIAKGAKRLKGGAYYGSGKPHKLLSRKVIPLSKMKKWLKSHVHDKPIHVSDLGLPKAKLKKIQNILQRLSGSGVFKKIKKIKKHAMKKTSDFFHGKTKYKPSQLLGTIGQVAGVGSIFMPELMIPAMLASAGARYAKSTGRGLELSGGKKWYKKIKTGRRAVDDFMSGNGVSLPGQGISLPGEGLRLAGETKPYRRPPMLKPIKLPRPHTEFMKREPRLAKIIAEDIVTLQGSGKSKKALKALGMIALPSLGAVAGALGYQQYLKRNPSKAIGLAGRSALGWFGSGKYDTQMRQLEAAQGTRFAKPLLLKLMKKKQKEKKGSGLCGGEIMLEGHGKVKARGSRAMVWHGSARKTSGGLTKNDLFLDPKDGRIKSKRKSALGKKMYERNKDKLKPHQFKKK